MNNDIKLILSALQSAIKDYSGSADDKYCLAAKYIGDLIKSENFTCPNVIVKLDTVCEEDLGDDVYSLIAESKLACFSKEPILINQFWRHIWHLNGLM